jgi:hypothetical protein
VLNLLLWRTPVHTERSVWLLWPTSLRGPKTWHEDMSKHTEYVTTSPISEIKLYYDRILKASESAVRGISISPTFLTIILSVYSRYADRLINLKSTIKSTADPSRQLHSMYLHKTVKYCRQTRHVTARSRFLYTEEWWRMTKNSTHYRENWLDAFRLTQFADFQVTCLVITHFGLI